MVRAVGAVLLTAIWIASASAADTNRCAAIADDGGRLDSTSKDFENVYQILLIIGGTLGLGIRLLAVQDGRQEPKAGTVSNRVGAA